VLVSRTVRDLVAGSDLRLEDRRAYTLKGLSESMPLFAVATERGP
jgi:class 3 adenylate cyclase